jgi:hypothetical protein
LSWLQQQLQAPREHLFENDQAAFSRAMDRYLVEHLWHQGALPALANWSLLTKMRASLGSDSRLALLRYVAVAAVNDTFELAAQGAKRMGQPLGRNPIA